MVQIPDAPWIRETERTGHYRFGWWNTPPEPEENEYDDFEEGDDDINPSSERDELPQHKRRCSDGNE